MPRRCSLRMSFWDRALEFRGGTPCSFADDDVHREQDRRLWH